MTSIIRADNISTVAGTGTIAVQAGNTLDASAGFTAPAGHVIQTAFQRYATNTTINQTSPVSFVDTGVTQDITIQDGNKILVHLILQSGQLYPEANMGMYQRIMINDAEAERCHHEEEHSAGYVLRDFPMQYLSGALSAGTYTVKCQVLVLNVGSSYFRFNWTGQGASSILVQEIQV